MYVIEVSSYHEVKIKHLRAVSEVGRVENVPEETREGKHDGAGHVICDQQRHRHGRSIRPLA